MYSLFDVKINNNANIAAGKMVVVMCSLNAHLVWEYSLVYFIMCIWIRIIQTRLLIHRHWLLILLHLKVFFEPKSNNGFICSFLGVSTCLLFFFCVAVTNTLWLFAHLKFILRKTITLKLFKPFKSARN